MQWLFQVFLLDEAVPVFGRHKAFETPDIFEVAGNHSALVCRGSFCIVSAKYFTACFIVLQGRIDEVEEWD